MCFEKDFDGCVTKGMDRVLFLGGNGMKSLFLTLH